MVKVQILCISLWSATCKPGAGHMGNIVLYHYISTYFSISKVSLITFSQIIYHSDKSSWRFTLWILGKLLHFASANFAQNEKLRRTG